MADKARIIESQLYTPYYINKGITRNNTVVNYLDMYGRDEPKRAGFMPVLGQLNHVSQSLVRPEFKTRYRFPDGLRHQYLDVYGTNNSTQKVTRADGFIDQDIRERAGTYWNPVSM